MEIKCVEARYEQKHMIEGKKISFLFFEIFEIGLFMPRHFG